MKQLILTLTLTCAALLSFAQAETPMSGSLSEKFASFYNKGQADSLFSMFSPEMKAALPLAKATDFFKGLNTQSGKIMDKKFIKYDQAYAVYLVKFERASFLLKLANNKSAQINGLSFVPYKIEREVKIPRNITPLKLPFLEEWTVIWGGDTEEQNYHVKSESQKNAFDFVITDVSGKSFKNDGKKNEDYFAFGKPIIAPSEGTIVSVINGVKDNIPGTTNQFNAGGNTVVILTKNGEYLVFCHLAHNSIKVKEGNKIKAGAFIGKCGNTGHSTEAHLHFHIQDAEDLNTGLGVKAYFQNIQVNGKNQQNYAPVKNDKIKQ